MAKKPAPNLAIVGTQTERASTSPPCKLGAVGMSLWQDILRSYEFNDRASYETLFQACAAADRAESLRQLIDRDGEVIRSKAGIRDHPALKHELQNRAFVARSLARLGLDLEPVRGIGRPPGGFA